jgi:Zn-finger nucleic acid-binding protein
MNEQEALRRHLSKCECPLCGAATYSVELVGLAARRIEECPKCTTYQITHGLEKLLSDPAVKPRIRYLSDAARRATAGGERLKLTEDNYLGIAAQEEALQRGE